MSEELHAWVRALHIVAVIAWMASLLYLPRLFVYHSKVPIRSKRSEMLKVMESRLLKVIMTPAIVMVFFLGIWLLFLSEVIDWSQGWIYVKLVLVLGLGMIHFWLAHWQRAFSRDLNCHNEKFYRRVNEVPTLLMVSIVILAVVKPF